MEKTPMQEMIDFCKENQDGEMPPKEFLFKAFELLEKEKQVIENAFEDAFCNPDFRDKDAQDYYNQKFKL